MIIQYILDMKLNNFTIQPYRIWYEYLQTALNDKNYSNKINQEYYKDWNLNSVKELTFNKWYQTHKNIFTQEDSTQIKVYDGKKTPNTLLVEIPINFTVVRIRKEIGKVLRKQIGKTQLTKKFKIQTNRPLQTPPLDYFRWTYEFRKEFPNKSNEEIWDLVSEKQKSRQKKYGVEKRIKKELEKKKKIIKIKKRFFASAGAVKGSYNKMILISKNVRKAKNILDNVCKGIFPGDYSIS